MGEEWEKQSPEPVSAITVDIDFSCRVGAKIPAGWFLLPYKQWLHALRLLWVPSGLTQKHLFRLEIAGMVEENRIIFSFGSLFW